MSWYGRVYESYDLAQPKPTRYVPKPHRRVPVVLQISEYPASTP